MTLGDIIYNYRCDYGMSMDEMAKKTGLSKSYVFMLEKYRKPDSGRQIDPTLQTVKKVADGLGFRYVEILSLLGMVNDPTESQVDSLLGQTLTGMDQDSIAEIVDYAQFIRRKKENEGL